MKKVIIFDMDGVLIDSEPEYLEMNKKLFKELGVDMINADYHEFVGMSSVKMWTKLRNKFNLPYEVEELMNKEKDLMYKILSSERISSPVEGVINLLDCMAERNFIICLASSSAMENINLVLDKLNLKKYFEYIVSGEDIEKGKPEPDIFLRVADNFNVPPEICFVIEDSTNGILASRAAKMKCVGFKNSGSVNQDLSKADLIVENFNEKNRNTIIDFIENN